MILVRPFAPAVAVGIVALAFLAGLRTILARRPPADDFALFGRLRLVQTSVAMAIARAGRRRRRLTRFDPVALLELGPAIVHGLLHVDDPAERILGNFLILAAAVGGADDPDGLGPAAGSLEEFAGDGAALVLVLERWNSWC